MFLETNQAWAMTCDVVIPRSCAVPLLVTAGFKFAHKVPTL